jgi:predicted Zn finger-like uncharacterized protein
VANEGIGPSHADCTGLGVPGLIVTCAECSTSFQLDESRIPVTGARVRCSRCKHAFFLPNPSASASQAVDAVAQEAVRNGQSSTPAATADLGASASGLSPSTVSGFDNDEEDWQFSEEVRVEGDDDLDSDGPFDIDAEMDGGLDPEIASEEASIAEPSLDLAGGPEIDEVGDDVAPGPEAGSGLALESEPEPVAAVSAPPATSAAAEPSRDASDFGSVDDFSSLMEDDDSATEDLTGDSGAELGTAAEVDASVGVYASNGSSDDLGDPESWDLVGSDDASAKGSRGRAVNRSQGNAFGQGVLDTAAAFETESPESIYEDEIGEAPVWARHLGGIGRVVGWAATIVMVAAALGLGLQREWQRWVQVPQVATAGPFIAETLSTGWVQTSRAGFVLVVEGQLRNDSGQPHWPGALQLALLDSAGVRLPSAPIRPGARLRETILRESTTSELTSHAQASIRRFSQTPLAAGEVRPFEAIVLEDELPETARRFLLEVGLPTTAPIKAAVAAPPQEEPATDSPGASIPDQLGGLSEDSP